MTGTEALYPPGGGVEPGEEPAETARRETLEETGLHVRVDPAASIVERYPFCWGGVDFDVTTHFFAASLEGAFDPALPAVFDAPYNLGAVWLPADEAMQGLAVHPPIADAVARVRRLAERRAWERDPHFSGPASMILGIHDQFRAAASELMRLVGIEGEPDVAAVRGVFEPLAQVLHHHHHAEEETLFPFVKLRTGVAPERLVADHAELVKAISDVERSLSAGDAQPVKAVVVAFEHVLVTHLAREETLVIPVLLAAAG